MYLKEHYVVLNQGEGNFGIHTSAVLLDPIKTFGTNMMLEIYNTGDQPVVNPLVSVEIFRAPAFTTRVQERWPGSAAPARRPPRTSSAASTESAPHDSGEARRKTRHFGPRAERHDGEPLRS